MHHCSDADLFPAAQALYGGHSDAPVPSSGGVDRGRVRSSSRHMEHGVYGEKLFLKRKLSVINCRVERAVDVVYVILVVYSFLYRSTFKFLIPIGQNFLESVVSAGFNGDVWVVFCRRLSWPQETICLSHIQGKTTLGMKVSAPFFLVFLFLFIYLFSSSSL